MQAAVAGTAADSRSKAAAIAATPAVPTATAPTAVFEAPAVSAVIAATALTAAFAAPALIAALASTAALPARQMSRASLKASLMSPETPMLRETKMSRVPAL